jgi:hypothetical protein
MTTVNPIPIQVRRGTAAEATAGNVVLLPGEFGAEDDTGKVKIGVAAGTAWNDLPYLTDAVAAALATEITAREAAVAALSATLASLQVAVANIIGTSPYTPPSTISSYDAGSYTSPNATAYDFGSFAAPAAYIYNGGSL